MPRGIYERPEGSGIWWILYYVGGKRRRERVGRKSDAIKLISRGKPIALAGRKLPEPHKHEEWVRQDGTP
jgi:hypothetical protein